LIGASASQQLAYDAAEAAPARLWRRYRGRGQPLHRGMPELRIVPMERAGLASSARHSITVAPSQCRAPILQHEVAHLIRPGTGHDPKWREAVMQMWADEFKLPRSISARLALESGIETSELSGYVFRVMRSQHSN
jgi:hypothetical protein